MISSASVKSFPCDAKYACIVLWVLSIPGLPALSVNTDQTLAIIKNTAPNPIAIGFVSIEFHMSYGIITKNMASGCTMHIAHAFLILAPNVVVKIPILKLANKNIPYVTKNNDASFASTTLASNPISNTAIHNIFPKRDACSDFEYSFFLVNCISIN